MHPVSRQFMDAMAADTRRVFGRVVIDYTDPRGDQSITATANQQANAAALLPQVADGMTLPLRRWASLDGSTLADGNSFPAPVAVADGQMGWWGTQLAGMGGVMVTPFPTLTVSFASRPVHSLRVVGDSVRGEWPVDFEIRLLGAGGTVRHTRTVIGNTLVDWQESITPVTEVTQYVLEVRRWSHAGRQAKILEAFTSVQETYEGDDLLELRLLEERELAQGSLPVGNVSANELTVRLNNAARRFDAGNRQSPLYQLLVQNRRMRAWLGLKGEGSGMNMQQVVDFNTGVRRNLVVNAGRLELPVVGAPSFSRASTAYRQDGTLVSAAVPRFEAGRFGQALMTEEGTTNLLRHSADFTQAIWARSNIILSAQLVFQNFLAARLTPNVSGSSAALSQTFSESTVAGRTFTWSFWARGETSRSFGINFWDGLNWRAVFIPLTPAWQHFEVAHTFLSGGTFGRIQWGNVSPHWGIAYLDWIELAGVQLEERPYATSYMESGAVAATRIGEVLTIPTSGVVNPVEGTVEFVWQPINQPAGAMVSQFTSPQIVRMGNYFGENSWVLWFLNRQLLLVVRGAGATGWTGLWWVIPDTAWYVLNRNYHMAVTWSGSNTFHVFVDGIQYGPYVSTHAFTGVAGNIMALGGSAASGHANALYDDFRISGRARTLAEHQAAVSSNQPLPIDADTTYLMRMDDNLVHGQGGDYTSPEYDLSTVGTGVSSSINWHSPADAVTREVSARLDGQAWTAVTNGGGLPFTPGQLLTGRRLQLHALLRRE